MEAMTESQAGGLAARLLGLQAILSFDKAQGLGFAFAIEPRIRRLFPAADERKRALRRHFEFFNTHPYLAGLVLGMTCSLEEDAARAGPKERAEKEERVVTLKRAVAAALAGIGDALFWATLRPCAAALALALGAILWPAGPERAAAWGVAAYLALFNLPVLALRLRGVWWGYIWKERVVERLTAIHWQAWRGRISYGGTFLIVAGLAARCMLMPGGWAAPIVTATALWGLLVFESYGVTAGRLYAGACVLGTLVRAASGDGP